MWRRGERPGWRDVFAQGLPDSVAALDDMVSEQGALNNSLRMPFGELITEIARAFEAVLPRLLAEGREALAASYMATHPAHDAAFLELLDRLAARGDWAGVERHAARAIGVRTRMMRGGRDAENMRAQVAARAAETLAVLREAVAWLEAAGDAADAAALRVHLEAGDDALPALAAWNGHEAVPLDEVVALAADWPGLVERALGLTEAEADALEAEAMATLVEQDRTPDEPWLALNPIDAAADRVLAEHALAGSEATRSTALAMFCRHLAESRFLPEDCAWQRDRFLAPLRAAGDRAAWRMVWRAAIAGPAKLWAHAMRQPDAIAGMRADTLALFDRRIAALEALGRVEKHDRVIEDRALFETGRSRPVPPVSDRRKIDETLFWQLVEEARREASGTAETLEALSARLTAFGPAGIKGFERALGRLLKQAYTWDLWALASAINGGCGDDGFEDFRCWLILQGRETFTRALDDPDAAWRWLVVEESPFAEDLLGVAAEIAALRGLDPDSLPARPAPVRPKGRAFDEDTLDARFPAAERAAP